MRHLERNTLKRIVQRAGIEISVLRCSIAQTPGGAAPVPCRRFKRTGLNVRSEKMDAMEISSRGEFGLWAIEVAKQIVSEHGFELARAARDGSEEDLRVAGNGLGQAITTALLEVFDGLVHVDDR